MSTDKLKEYLNIVLDMEKHIQLQKDLLDALQEKIVSLKVPTEFPVPLKPSPPSASLPALSLPVLPEQKYENLSAWEWIKIILGWIKIILGTAYTAICTGIAAFFVGLLIFGILSPFTDAAALILIFVIGFPFFAFIAPIFFRVRDIFTTRKENAVKRKEYWHKVELLKQEHSRKIQEYQQEYQIELANYKASCEEYERQMQEYAHRQMKDEEIRKNAVRFLENECEQITVLLEQSQNRLDKIYAANVVFPKYRNLVMLSSLCEYVNSGRCVQLEGAHGGYNILEEELRLDHIITRLDKIVTQLDEIKSRQYMLYTIVRDSNRMLEQLLNSTYDIIVNSLSNITDQQSAFNDRLYSLQAKSEFIAYQTERTNKELQYINRVKYFIN